MFAHSTAHPHTHTHTTCVLFIWDVSVNVNVNVIIIGIFITCWLANAIRNDDDEIVKIHNGHHLHTHSET
ncbi:hypothetical protein HUJ05_010942 [Dendroctonus ponderosae]|nr:hypothetical protein HUJ05_010942 [Dendroctonus ponderosae]